MCGHVVNGTYRVPGSFTISEIMRRFVEAGLGQGASNIYKQNS